MWKFSLYKITMIELPFRKRTTRFKAWIRVSVSYLVMIIDDLFVLWDSTIAEARMTPQVIYLERILNNRYGRTDIFISEGFTLGPWVYLITETAVPQFYLDQADSYVFHKDDHVVVDFIVNIPEALIDEVQVIASTINKFKLLGKYFIIQIY